MIVRVFLGVLFGAALFAAGAAAEEPQAEDGWQFDMTTYLWTPGISGDATIKGQKADVDASFIDIVKDTDTIFAYNGQFGLSKGDFSLLFSPTYMKLTASDHATTGLGRARIDTDVELTYLELAGLYRVGSWTVGYNKSTPQTLSVEPLAGVRYTRLKGDLDLNVSGVPGKASRDGTKDWVDPIVGLRSILSVTDDIDFTVRGDVGGFGVGSDFTWQLASNLSYGFTMFNRDARVFAGYRALYQHYKDGSGNNKFEWDTTLYGPILGLSITF